MQMEGRQSGQIHLKMPATVDTLTESLTVLNKALLKRMKNWVRQLAETL